MQHPRSMHNARATTFLTFLNLKNAAQKLGDLQLIKKQQPALRCWRRWGHLCLPNPALQLHHSPGWDHTGSSTQPRSAESLWSHGCDWAYQPSTNVCNIRKMRQVFSTWVTLSACEKTNVFKIVHSVTPCMVWQFNCILTNVSFVSCTNRSCCIHAMVFWMDDVIVSACVRKRQMPVQEQFFITCSLISKCIHNIGRYSKRPTVFVLKERVQHMFSFHKQVWCDFDALTCLIFHLLCWAL